MTIQDISIAATAIVALLALLWTVTSFFLERRARQRDLAVRDKQLNALLVSQDGIRNEMGQLDHRVHAVIDQATNDLNQRAYDLMMEMLSKLRESHNSDIQSLKENFTEAMRSVDPTEMFKVGMTQDEEGKKEADQDDSALEQHEGDTEASGGTAR